MKVLFFALPLCGKCFVSLQLNFFTVILPQEGERWRLWLAEVIFWMKYLPYSFYYAHWDFVACFHAYFLWDKCVVFFLFTWRPKIASQWNKLCQWLDFPTEQSEPLLSNMMLAIFPPFLRRMVLSSLYFHTINNAIVDFTGYYVIESYPTMQI